MFDLNNMQQMISHAKEAQDRYKSELEKMAVRGSAGGDTVSVVLNGRKEVTKIEFGTLPSSPTLLADMVLSALNAAYAQVDKQVASLGPGQMSDMMNNINISDVMAMFKK